MTVARYPLTWPPTLPRTKTKQTSKFKTGLTTALDNVRKSLSMFGSDSGKPVKDMVISSNVTLGISRPDDPGVAVWFQWDGLSVCIAVDRYSKVEDNLQAIHHIIEARRTELRHGGLNIVRATFTGFAALPAPAGTRSWREVFDYSATARPRIEDIQSDYRNLSRTAHPDHPDGSHDKMAELNRAREEALKELES